MNLGGTVRPRVARTTMLQATAIFLLSMLLYRGILHAQHRAPDAALPAAIVLALGAFGTAATLWRHSVVPNWSRFASAGVIATAMVVSALLAPEAMVERRAQPWMLPWILLFMGSMTPSRREAACVSAEATGRVMLVISGVVGAAYVLAAFFGHPF